MNPIFTKLGAVNLHNVPDRILRPNVQNILNIELPHELVSLLQEVQGPVFFDNQANFKPLEPCGAEDKKGYNSIQVLFGLGDGSLGLEDENRPRESLPEGLVAIGELPGGDLLCLDRETMEVVRWDHEADEEDSVTLIAHDFDSFIASLKTEAEVEAEG